MKKVGFGHLSRYVLSMAAFFFLFTCPDSVSLGDVVHPVKNSDEISLTLDQVFNRALLANRHLLGTGLFVQNSRYSLDNARSAFDWKIQPVANIGLSKNENTTEQASGISGEISKKSSSGIKVSLLPSVAYVDGNGASSGVGVSLSVPILRSFGREYTFAAVDAADFSLQTSIRNVYLAEVQTILDSVTRVYNILRQQELVDLYSLQEKRLHGHVATAKIKEKTGLGTPIDSYRAQIRLKDVQDQLTVAQEKHQGMQDQLKIFLALPIESVLQVKAPVTYTSTRIQLQQATKIALENRIEMKQAAADLAEARRKSKVARRGLLPDLNFVATYRKNSFLQGLASSDSYYGDYWSVGLTSSTDLARNKEKTVFQQSLLEVRRMKLQQQDQRDTILAEVKEQLNALTKEEERIHLRREQIQQARGKMRLAEIKFSHAMGNNFDLIESETELQRAKVNLLNEETAYIVGQYRLRAALGTLITQ